MKYISSLQNSLIKTVVALKDKKLRRKEKKFVVEGFRALEPFLEQNWPCFHVFLTRKASESAPEWFLSWVNSLPKASTEAHASDSSVDFTKSVENLVSMVSFDVLKRISSQTTPSGILAVFEQKSSKLLIAEQAGDLVLQLSGYKIKKESFQECVVTRGLVLYQIQDPGNMGALIRTSVAFDAPCFIVGGCDPWSPKVLQASAGALAYAKLVQISWEQLVSLASSAKNMLTALVLHEGNEPSRLKLERALLVVGSEAHGLPDTIVSTCDQRMTIPMQGRAESLNAAVAGSIALYAAFLNNC